MILPHVMFSGNFYLWLLVFEKEICHFANSPTRGEGFAVFAKHDNANKNEIQIHIKAEHWQRN